MTESQDLLRKTKEVLEELCSGYTVQYYDTVAAWACEHCDAPEVYAAGDVVHNDICPWTKARELLKEITQLTD